MNTLHIYTKQHIFKMTTYLYKVCLSAVLRCWLRLLGSWLAWRQVWRTLPGGWRQPGILCWPVANQRPVFRSRDLCWPIRGRCGDRNWPMRSECSCPLQAGNHCHTVLSWLTEMVEKPRFTLVDGLNSNTLCGKGHAIISFIWENFLSTARRFLHVFC